MISQHPIPDWLDVSRETLLGLSEHLTLVYKWNPAINLVSSGSLTNGWTRHVLDSAQLIPQIRAANGCWLDMGSGAGFPGLVVAILAREVNPELHVVVVESDRRKATFLSEAARKLDVSVEIICARIEGISSLGANIISARAFAPLEKLLQDASLHWAPLGFGLFLKGRNYKEEVSGALTKWHFDFHAIDSKTDPDSVVLRVEGAKYDRQ